mmetsp:Transcript_10734/g.34109  ORF Transcript_10734/g.34109 Transcript_10734/m.34109 type:complete len:394 (+) Transcript_10734:48-1229(+)
MTGGQRRQNGWRRCWRQRRLIAGWSPFTRAGSAEARSDRDRHGGRRRGLGSHCNRSCHRGSSVLACRRGRGGRALAIGSRACWSDAAHHPCTVRLGLLRIGCLALQFSHGLCRAWRGRAHEAARGAVQARRLVPRGGRGQRGELVRVGRAAQVEVRVRVERLVQTTSKVLRLHIRQVHVLRQHLTLLGARHKDDLLLRDRVDEGRHQLPKHGEHARRIHDEAVLQTLGEVRGHHLDGGLGRLEGGRIPQTEPTEADDPGETLHALIHFRNRTLQRVYQVPHVVIVRRPALLAGRTHVQQRAAHLVVPTNVQLAHGRLLHQHVHVVFPRLELIAPRHCFHDSLERCRHVAFVRPEIPPQACSVKHKHGPRCLCHELGGEQLAECCHLFLRVRGV